MTDVAHRSAETASTTPDRGHDGNVDQPSSRKESTLVPTVMSIITVLMVLVIAIRPVKDVDVWWHLKAGQFVLNGGAFVGPDPWVPFASRPFILNQWLPEVIAFKGYTWFGLPAVAWLRCVAILLILSAILWCTRRVADTVPALITALAALVGTGGSLSERPQLVSFILLAVWVGAWWRTAEDLRPRWWLIPLTWVWACSHGMWITGIGVGVIVICGLILDKAHRPASGQADDGGSFGQSCCGCSHTGRTAAPANSIRGCPECHIIHSGVAADQPPSERLRDRRAHPLGRGCSRLDPKRFHTSLVADRFGCRCVRVHSGDESHDPSRRNHQCTPSRSLPPASARDQTSRYQPRLLEALGFLDRGCCADSRTGVDGGRT